MTDPQTESANRRLAAATAALGEHDQLAAMRTRIATDLTAWNAHIEHLKRELARERHEVQERLSGLSGFFYALIGDERLSQEQREAVEAEARLGEATSSRDQLAAHLAHVDARLATQRRADLAAAVAAAREAKEAALLLSHGPTADKLQDLAVRIEAIDIELVPLESAVTAGEAALTKLAAVITVLERARDERLEQDDARGMAGAAQASITMFQRAVDGLGSGDDDTAHFATLVDPRDREPFVDPWIRALVGKGDRTARLETARAAMIERHQRVTAQLASIRARRDQLASRRAALAAEREAVLHA